MDSAEARRTRSAYPFRRLIYGNEGIEPCGGCGRGRKSEAQRREEEIQAGAESAEKGSQAESG